MTEYIDRSDTRNKADQEVTEFNFQLEYDDWTEIDPVKAKPSEFDRVVLFYQATGEYALFIATKGVSKSIYMGKKGKEFE